MDAEVLVHIKGPTSKSDDEKYLALAQNILNFRPISTVRLPGVHSGYQPATQDSPLLCLDQNGSAPNVEHSLREETISQNQAALKRRRSGEDLQTRDGEIFASAKSPRTPRHRCSAYFPAKGSNLTYKNPMRTQKDYPQNSVLDPPTQPNMVLSTSEHSEGILVPDTCEQTVPATKRHHSPSSEGRDSCDSQIIHDSTSCLGPLSRVSRPLASPIILEKCQIHVDRSDHLVPTEILDQQTIIKTNDPGWFDRILHDASIMARSTSHEIKDPYRLQNHYWNLQQRLSSYGKKLDIKMDHIQVLHLGREADMGTSYRNQAQARNKQGTILHHMSRDRNASSTQVAKPSNECSFSNLQDLPLIINGPDPTAAQVSAPSFDIPALKLTADALGMPRCFGPTEMTRGVKSRERGYWKVTVDITTSESGPSGKSHSDQQLLGQHTCSLQSLSRLPSLTEQEFLVVWKDLTEYISSGNAGWSVRVIRRNLRVSPDIVSLQGHRRLDLQIYCYGEAIPYIYAMLLFCTRLHLLYMPLEWISANDGKSVIIMAGSEVEKGNLAPWTCYSDRHGVITWRCQPSTNETIYP